MGTIHRAPLSCPRVVQRGDIEAPRRRCKLRLQVYASHEHLWRWPKARTCLPLALSSAGSIEVGKQVRGVREAWWVNSARSMPISVRNIASFSWRHLCLPMRCGHTSMPPGVVGTSGNGAGTTFRGFASSKRPHRHCPWDRCISSSAPIGPLNSPHRTLFWGRPRDLRAPNAEKYVHVLRITSYAR